MNPFRLTKEAGPYAAGVAPETAAHVDGLKAEAIRRALKAGLLGLAGGGGLAAALAAPQFMSPPKVPSFPAEDNIDLPYPQVASEEEKERARRRPHSKAAEFIVTPVSSAAGAALGRRTAEDPIEGALYGGARGMMRGAAFAPGTVVGGALADKLTSLKPVADRIGAMAPSSGKAVKSMASAAGSLVGGVASRKALNPFVESAAKKTMGDPPKMKRDATKTELALTGEDPKVYSKKADLSGAAVKALGLSTPTGHEPSGFTGWMRGDSADSVGAVPWAIPAAAGAAGAGIFGGHAMVMHMLRKRRKDELKAQLDAAQKEYEEAMLAQYDPSTLRNLSPKEAAAPASALDACFDALEKDAGVLNDAMGHGAGLYLTGAGALGLGTALGTYRWLEGRSSQKTLKDALKRRALLRALANPPSMHVRPVPVEYVGESEEDKSNPPG